MSKEDLLANCIDEIDSGKCTIEECLAKHPDLKDELRPLLEVAQCLQAENVVPSKEFRLRARSRLLEEMRQPAPVPVLAPRRSIFDWLRPLAPALKPAVAVALVIAGLSAAGTTTIYASQASLPQDSLYPVKRGVENLQIALTPDPADKARLNSTLAQRRVEEAVAQARLGREISESALQSAAVHIDAAVKEISAAKPEQAKSLLIKLSRTSLDQQLELSQVLQEVPEASRKAVQRAIETTRRAGLIASTAYGNPAFLTTSPSVDDDELEAAHFEVDGEFLGDEDGSWNVGGVLIKNVNSPKDAPVASENVHVEGLVRGGKAFISQVKRQEDGKDKVVIAGTFKGATSDGTDWRVGGIQVTKPQDTDTPPQGSQVQVKGTVHDRDFVGTIEQKQEDEEKGVEVKGSLVEVDSEQNTITVAVSGSKVVINLRDASVLDASGNPLSLTDLTQSQGADIKATGLNKKDGVVSAKRVRVDPSLRTAPGRQKSDKDRDSEKQSPKEEKKPGQGDGRQGQIQPAKTPTPPGSQDNPQTRPTPRVTPTEETERRRATAIPVPKPTLNPPATPGRETRDHDQEQPPSYRDRDR